MDISLCGTDFSFFLYTPVELSKLEAPSGTAYKSVNITSISTIAPFGNSAPGTNMFFDYRGKERDNDSSCSKSRNVDKKLAKLLTMSQEFNILFSFLMKIKASWKAHASHNNLNELWYYAQAKHTNSFSALGRWTLVLVSSTNLQSHRQIQLLFPRTLIFS